MQIVITDLILIWVHTRCNFTRTQNIKLVCLESFTKFFLLLQGCPADTTSIPPHPNWIVSFQEHFTFKITNKYKYLLQLKCIFAHNQCCKWFGFRRKTKEKPFTPKNSNTFHMLSNHFEAWLWCIQFLLPPSDAIKWINGDL